MRLIFRLTAVLLSAGLVVSVALSPALALETPESKIPESGCVYEGAFYGWIESHQAYGYVNTDALFRTSPDPVTGNPIVSYTFGESGGMLRLRLGLYWSGQDALLDGPVIVSWESEIPWVADDPWADVLRGEVLHFPAVSWIRSYPLSENHMEWYAYNGNYSPTAAVVDVQSESGVAVMWMSFGVQWIEDETHDLWPDWNGAPPIPAPTNIRLTALNSGEQVTCSPVEGPTGSSTTPVSAPDSVPLREVPFVKSGPS